VRKQQELDRICGKWGLRWRKDRDADGRLHELKTNAKVPKYTGRSTFIQEANKKFKEYFAEHGCTEYVKEHFSDYPAKHKLQCNLNVHKMGLEPPRYSAGKLAH